VRLTVLVAASALVTSVVQAQRTPTPNELEQAADVFDAGVDAFERADYAVAVRQFLRADALVPNTDALFNALEAAKRTKNDALVATAASRAVSREALAPKLAARARKALEDAEPRVARLVLSCEPTPCELALDGEPVPAGTSYALSGKHVVTVSGPNGARSEHSLEAVAGGRYALELEPRPNTASVPVPPSNEPRTPPAAAAQSREPERDAEPPLPPPVFYAGVGVTIALAAATTWSGIDTLRAKERLPGTESDNADVLSRAHRTDALLIGTAVVGAATAYVGLVLTDWDGPGSRTALGASLVEGGAFLSITGTH
jgi:hypothetical protein